VDDFTVRGFRFAGARGGIKQKPGLDVGLIAADAPAATAALFTGNRVKAAPVRLSQRESLLAQSASASPWIPF
jgi:glutamate N-acetyltransferase/amino-acid N-acetyltransferase